MIEQLKTIREALEAIDNGCQANNLEHTLAAIAQLEAMVESVEPVAWEGGEEWESLAWALCAEENGEDACSELIWDGGPEPSPWGDRWLKYEGEAKRLIALVHKHTAPVAQQYEAGDVASASAQGFRDGVASVAQQPRQCGLCGSDEAFTGTCGGGKSNPRALCYETVAQQPQAEPRKADVARTCPFCNEEWVEQPQARPDFTDEWAGYLKDGETPFERFLRERKDMQSVLKLYQRVLEENERLKAQQPQAEAVPQATEFCWLVEHFDVADKSTGLYYTGKLGIADRVLTTMDANEAKRYDTWREANLASVKLGSTLTGTWRAVQHGFHTIPQQAEAVPSDVVRDAERYRWLFSGHTEDELNADALAGRQPTMTAQDQLIADFSAWYTLKKTADAKIDAAMAQGEKP